MKNITNPDQDYPQVRQTAPSRRPPRSGTWKHELARAIRDPAELLSVLELPESLLPGALRAARQFPLVAPRGFVNRMRPGDPRDPLLLQVLPLAEEEIEEPGTFLDPLEEARATLGPGVLQKYHGRALLVTTGVCAIHCRYCFRRHHPYEDSPRGLEAWEAPLESLRERPEITEVILSGGDPLSLTDESLAGLIERIERIPQVRRLRLHTRLPVVIPERVTGKLVELLEETRLRAVVVLHVNHARELDASCREALGRLARAGRPLLNQAVLLRGINDDEDRLAELSESLVDAAVIPYYLHQMDPVRGAGHFHVPPERGLELIEALRRRLPGYAVPRFVREDPGEDFKTPLG